VSLEGLAPGFSSALQRLIAAAPGRITISSGYRSPERQQQLWDQALAKYGDPEIADNWVARPGRSNHNHGVAADLSFENDEVRQWVHANAAKFGLHFPMGHEPWHIEPIDADSAGHTTGGEGGEGMEEMVGAPQEFNLAQRLDAVLKIVGQSPIKAGTMTVEGDVGASPKMMESIGQGGTKTLEKIGQDGGGGKGGPIKEYTRRVMAERYGWGDEEWGALDELVRRESSWNPEADNPTSTAYGLYQFLDGTWAGTGIGRTSDPYRQTDAGLIYIQQRYGSPRAALAHHDRMNWY
jgi:D-alanyl-D-alanine carboxypeptidase/Transglycosylase SLT domain